MLHTLERLVVSEHEDDAQVDGHRMASLRTRIQQLSRTIHETEPPAEPEDLEQQHCLRRWQLLGRAFENAQEGVVLLNADACVEEANTTFLQIAQRSATDVVGQQLVAILEWAFPQYDETLRSVMEGQAWSGRVAVARGDCDERRFLVSFSPVVTNDEVESVVVFFSDVTDIDRSHRRLKRMALHDQLTGLPNRRFYRERVQSLMDGCRQPGAAFAICFLDLDNFKQINDTLGHPAGDELLIEVARRLRMHAGSDAFVSRFGGDEFALLIPNTDTDLRKVATITDHVLQAIREPIRLGENEEFIGASIGVTEYPVHSADIDQLLQNADVAMYAAKRGGRNQVRVFSSEMQAELEKRHQIQIDLQRALRGNEITLHYQPLVDLKTGALEGCEALARWRTPDGRDISPADFVPVAENSGLVIPLGELVLMTACQQAAEWEALNCRPPVIAVNISPHHLHHPLFVERVARIFEVTGVDPKWMTFEVTENAVNGDVQRALSTMDALVAMGVSLSIDDFGTGHSSLSDLKRFNIHTLKVDRSFVRDLVEDDAARAMVQSIIHLAHGRNLQVIAEGIETQDQHDMLREMSCDLGQGYHIARPLQPVELEHWWDATTAPTV